MVVGGAAVRWERRPCVLQLPRGRILAELADVVPSGVQSRNFVLLIFIGTDGIIYREVLSASSVGPGKRKNA